MIPEAFNVFVPAYLYTLGYQDIGCVAELGKRGSVVGDAIRIRQKWAAWRGILEYVACVEYARRMLHEVAQSGVTTWVAALGSRYNAASLVFFGQATLDNVANWLNRRFSMDLKGSHCQLHKKGFRDALEATTNGHRIVEAVQRHKKFLADLQRYRQIWIHSLVGGATPYANKSPARAESGFSRSRWTRQLVPFPKSIWSSTHEEYRLVETPTQANS